MPHVYHIAPFGFFRKLGNAEMYLRLPRSLTETGASCLQS
jgi:hypothetical protein